MVAEHTWAACAWTNAAKRSDHERAALCRVPARRAPPWAPDLWRSRSMSIGFSTVAQSHPCPTRTASGIFRKCSPDAVHWSSCSITSGVDSLDPAAGCVSVAASGSGSTEGSEGACASSECGEAAVEACAGRFAVAVVERAAVACVWGGRLCVPEAPWSSLGRGTGRDLNDLSRGVAVSCPWPAPLSGRWAVLRGARYSSRPGPADPRFIPHGRSACFRSVQQVQKI